MLRMKIQTIRSLLWVGNLLAISGIALLIGKLYVGNRPGSKMFESISNDKIEIATRVESSIPPRSTGGSRDWSQLDNCWKLNVTGKEDRKVVETGDGPGPKAQPLKPIDEVLRVDMMLAAGPKSSRASLHYLEDGDSGTPAGKAPVRQTTPERRETPEVAPNLVHVGDSLRPPYDGAPYNGKVQEITSEGVKIFWGDDIVVLQAGQLERALGGEPRTLPGLNDEPPDEAQLAFDAEQAKLSRPLDDDSWFIGTVERDKIIAEQTDLAAEIGVGPAYSKREKRMYVKITKIPEGSLAERRGFKEGDVLRRINGTDIVSKADLVRYVQKHPEQPRYKIEIMRRGSRITKIFQIAR